MNPVPALSDVLAIIPWPDLFAPCFFIGCWLGYALYADIFQLGEPSLMSRMERQRANWLHRTLERDNRIVDIQIVQVLIQNVSFFASGAILIVGGLLAIFGSGENVRTIIKGIPFLGDEPELLWDFKILMLVVIFVYAFFKFTWSLRQFNYVAILVGSMPYSVDEEARREAERVASVASSAGDHFNRAMRAYYFGLAALSWFIHAWALVIASLWVVLVLYRREYRSQVVSYLGENAAPVSARPKRSPRAG